MSHTRRSAIAASLAAGAVAAAPAGAAPAPELTGHEHDWDWLVGRWNVLHRRLKGRLVGSSTWEEFRGTSHLWLTLGGLGTVDDNVLQLPGGTYRAVGLRAFNPKTNLWAIWWLDGRNPDRIDTPVYGGFKDGLGTFMADDVQEGRPVKVRFQWSEMKANSARWEQAFSTDGGATWEVNWRMWFTRAG